MAACGCGGAVGSSPSRGRGVGAQFEDAGRRLRGQRALGHGAGGKRRQQKENGIDLENANFGIFGGVVAPTHVLAEGDRVEIYRPLIADPKEVRKQRAAEGKVMKKGGGDAGEA